MKELIIVINEAVPFGRALNAAAHTVLGMGHRIPADKTPNIAVFLASHEQLVMFKQAAYELYINNPATVVYADFTNTMVGGTTDEQLIRTSNTHEADLEYFAVSICADDDLLLQLKNILSKTIPNYKPLINKDAVAFNFLPVPALLDNHDPVYKQFDNHKAVIAFNKKHDIAESINFMILACLDLGKQALLISLHLLLYVDADGMQHPNISYHAMPIVTAKNQGKLDTIAEQVQQNDALVASVVKDDTDVVQIVGVFGEAEIVNPYTKQCSLWTKEIIEENL